jgi:DNA topoisomerase-1
MARALVVVESPTKAKTINKYLGRGYSVIASMGHIRDLPKSRLGVDVERGFEPEYIPIVSRKKVIRELRDAARTATEVFIATDPDREGEAIGWHIAEELGGKKRKFHRLFFNEITKKAVLEAIKHPVEIDRRMVDAQQARRVLDRLVGYSISPLLWDKVRRGLSAGRVQSVALKLICDREREIEQFRSEEYWNLFARLAGAIPPEFEARLIRQGSETPRVRTEAESSRLVAALEPLPFVVSAVATKERRRSAPPPFITSKLQQAARFPVKKTMMIAQQLYEGIDLPGEGAVGLITYMRTDSTRVSDQALAEVRDHITSTFGGAFVPEKPNSFRAKADVQDAHEAIRPTSMRDDPETVRSYLTPDQYSLYRLIWNRFVASQMAPAVFDDTTVDVTAGDCLFRVKGSVPKFGGWLAVYGGPGAEAPDAGPTPAAAVGGGGESDEESAAGVLPPLQEGERLTLRGLRPDQRFTQPPPRYSEATLVKELEENGIGRPSTYASILGTIQDRDYVEKVQGRFRPTPMGVIVTDLVIPFFDDIIGVSYTARMEEQLDEIERGKSQYQETLSSFYEKFKADLDRAEREMPNLKEGVDTGEICDKCGANLLKKVGRFGPFLACSRYPECTNTKEIELEGGAAGLPDGTEVCENCGRPMVVKRGRFGQFLACSGYPECKTTRKLVSTKQGIAAAKPDQVLDEKCPQCGANLVRKQGRFGEFVACSSYPACKFVQLRKTGVSCPKDGGEIVERRSRRGKLFFGCSNYPACEFTLWNRPVAERCPVCGSSFLVEKTTKRHGRQLVCSNESCEYVRSEELGTA